MNRSDTYYFSCLSRVIENCYIFGDKHYNCIFVNRQKLKKSF